MMLRIFPFFKGLSQTTHGVLMSTVPRLVLASLLIAGASQWLRISLNSGVPLENILLHNALGFVSLELSLTKYVAQNRSTQPWLVAQKRKRNGRPVSLRPGHNREFIAQTSECGRGIEDSQPACPSVVHDRSPSCHEVLTFPMLPVEDPQRRKNSSKALIQLFYDPLHEAIDSTKAPVNGHTYPFGSSRRRREGWRVDAVGDCIDLLFYITAVVIRVSLLVKYCYVKSCDGAYSGKGSFTQKNGGGGSKQRDSRKGGARKATRKDYNSTPGSNGRDNDEDGDQGDDDDGNADGIYEDSNEDNGNGSSFACHFLYFDPAKHAACAAYSLKRWSDLVQHLKRQHCSTSPHYCPTCYLEFGSIEAWEQHVAAKICRKNQGPTKFYPQELDELKAELRLVKRPAKRSADGAMANLDLEKWYWLWDKCFSTTRPKSLPFLDSALVENAKILRSINHGPVNETLKMMFQEVGVLVDDETALLYSEKIMDAAYNTPPRPELPWRFRSSNRNTSIEEADAIHPHQVDGGSAGHSLADPSIESNVAANGKANSSCTELPTHWPLASFSLEDFSAPPHHQDMVHDPSTIPNNFQPFAQNDAALPAELGMGLLSGDYPHQNRAESKFLTSAFGSTALNLTPGFFSSLRASFCQHGNAISPNSQGCFTTAQQLGMRSSHAVNTTLGAMDTITSRDRFPASYALDNPVPAVGDPYASYFQTFNSTVVPDSFDDRPTDEDGEPSQSTPHR